MSAHRTLIAAILVAACAGVAACTPDDAPEPSPSGDPTVAPTEDASPPELAVSRSVVVNDQEIELAVGPVVVEDGYATLSISAEGSGSGSGSLSLGVALNRPFGDSRVGPSAVRLVDHVAGTVSPIARGADGKAVMSSGSFATDAPVTMYAVFAAPTGDTVDVLVPYAGYFEDVPVVTADDAAEVEVADLADLTGSPAQELALPVVPLETYTEDLTGSVRTRTEEDEVTVAISADVLFATDSADLGAEADGALAAAGQQIALYSAGALTVVGHTDDVASDAYNQDLSVRRAQAVADRIGQLVDLSPYALAVEGRGESEPAVAGTSTDARAANRRVELRFVPTPDATRADEAPQDPAAPDLAPSDGPEGTGQDGVQFSFVDETDLEVTLPELRRVGDYLVGELRVEHVGGASRNLSYAFSSGVKGSRGVHDPQLQWAATNLTLVADGVRYYALDYVRDDEGARDPLADRYLNQTLEEGQVQTVTVVWPAVAADSVVLDAPSLTTTTGDNQGGPPFRLTDIPVVSP